MSKVAISTPELSINGDKYGVVPNSITYDIGEGEINVRSASLGGAESESVHTVNAESMISMIKFSLYNKFDTDSDIRAWKNDVGGNAVQLTQKVGVNEKIVRFPGMSCTDSVERDIGADGVTEVTFKGDQAVI